MTSVIPTTDSITLNHLESVVGITDVILDLTLIGLGLVISWTAVLSGGRSIDNGV